MLSHSKSFRPRFWVRSAAQADIPAFIDFKNRCWEETYRGLLADSVFEQLESKRDEQITFWREELPRQNLFVAEDEQGNVVGAAASKGSELTLLYVAENAAGNGVGSRLLAEVAPEGKCTLWVFEQNDRAQQFYARRGFAATGNVQTSDLPGQYGPVQEIEMIRE